MRLIDADALIEKCKDIVLTYPDGSEYRHRCVDPSVIRSMPSVQITYCKDCQWLADIKDIETGELYHTCGVLGFDTPEGFACNQGKQRGADS